MKKNKERLHDLWYIINRTSFQIIEVPERGKKEMSAENVFKDVSAK